MPWLNPIDATKPVDGVPSVKTDLRTNLAIAKRKLEDTVNVKDFGALGTDSSATVATWIPSRFANITAARTATGIADLATTDTVDWAAFQMALNVDSGVYVPAGHYRINRSLIAKNMRIMGTKGNGWRSPAKAMIETIGSFGQRPMLLFADWWFDWDYALQINGDPAGGQFYLADLCFGCGDPFGMVAQFPGALGTSKIERCWIGSSGRGVALSGSYETSIENCYIGGFLDYGTRETDWAASGWEKGVGLYAHNHCTVTCCTFNKCGVGLSAQGNGIHISGCRAEENVLGYEIGNCGIPDVNADHGYNPFSGGYGIYRSTVTACSAEANRYGIRLRLGRTSSIKDFEVHGSTNRAAGTRGQGGYGFEIWGINENASLENVATFGGFEDEGVRFVGSASYMGSFERLLLQQSDTTRPSFAGSSVLISKNNVGNLDYHFSRMPLNSTIADGNTNGNVTAFSDLALRGITGLAYHKPHVQANNLGGIEAVSGTTHAVVFPTAEARHDADSLTVQADVGSTLAPGTYYYVVTLQTRTGETSYAPVNTSLSHVTRTIASGQRMRMQAWNQPGAVLRLYRGTVLNRFDGYFNAPAHATGGTVTFDDIGQAFDGRDTPPIGGAEIPSSAEFDTNYAVVATASWATNVYVTAKATTGFTLNFTTAPGGGIVQWLLFRP